LFKSLIGRSVLAMTIFFVRKFLQPLNLAVAVVLLFILDLNALLTRSTRRSATHNSSSVLA
jgi:hypothetical protein